MFVMVRRHERWPVVLGAVDQMIGKPGEHLPIGHLDRLGAERAHHLAHQLRLLHPDPQAPEVCDAFDGAGAVVDRAGPGIVEGEPDETVGLEAAKDLAADRPVQHLLHVLDGPEQERHGEHVHRRDEIADQRHIGPVEVDRAGPGLLDGLLLLAELAGMKNLDLVPAAGALGDQRAHVAQRLDGRVILGLGVGGAKFTRNGARRANGEQKRDENHPGP
ncbi:hypothetical protein ABIF53_005649 [Bradyrhizobium japonicum]